MIGWIILGTVLYGAYKKGPDILNSLSEKKAFNGLCDDYDSLAEMREEASSELSFKQEAFTKQSEICTNIDAFRNLVNSFANSIDRDEVYDIRRFSMIEDCLSVFSKSKDYIPDSVLSDLKSNCNMLDRALCVMLQKEKCSEIQKEKLSQVRNAIQPFLSLEPNQIELIQRSDLSDLERRIKNIDGRMAEIKKALTEEP